MSASLSCAANRLINLIRTSLGRPTLAKRQLTGGNARQFVVKNRRTAYIVGGLTFAVTLTGPLVYSTVNDWIQSRSNLGHSSENVSGSFQSSVVRYVPSNVLNGLTISRSMAGPNTLPGVDRIVLLQYQSCPFCCKVRTFLDFHGLAYDVVEVNPVLRTQLRFSPYRKVPILLVQQTGEPSKLLQLNDSSAIISILGTHLARHQANSSESPPSSSPKSERLEDVARSYHELVFVTSEGRQEKHGLANQYFLLLGDRLSDTQYEKMGDQLLEERRWRKWADDVLGKLFFCDH